jgi:hypothetical protein
MMDLYSNRKMGGDKPKSLGKRESPLNLLYGMHGDGMHGHDSVILSKQATDKRQTYKKY